MTIGTARPSSTATLSIGANYLGENRCEFRVWAPNAREMAVDVYEPLRRTEHLIKDESGYWTQVLEKIPPGTRYKYRIDGARSFPDPASRYQPEGVHGPSEVIDPAFDWTAQNWHGIPIENYIIYELHVGAFTPEGTFGAAGRELGRLRDLGVTAVELMPVAQFPGSRNWGYDGVYLYAVQSSYGGPEALKRFVDAAHRLGLAVILDVVYNHLGPEGNYFSEYGPYFTSRYHTPWGQALDFDGPDSAPVRNYFLNNALYWVRDFRIDGLRLDAVHAIVDNSPTHLLTEIADTLHHFGRDHQRTITVTAESDLNEARLVRPCDVGGCGLDAQWSDDFHHSLHSVLTGERSGYYEDFGRIEDLATAMSDGFVFTGQHSPHRGRVHGTDPSDLPGRTFVVCAQNHDQIGNRMLGERLSHLTDLDGLKIAAGILLLSPFVPLLFMGQEYAETAPFLYFVSHSDPGLVEAVREGRKREFASFAWQGEVPDAQDEATFLRSKLHPEMASQGRHAVLLRWYRALIDLRKRHPALKQLDRQSTDVQILGTGHTILLRRWASHCELMALFHFGRQPETVLVETAAGSSNKLLDSRAPEWMDAAPGLPPLLAGNGALRIELPPRACLVLDSGRPTEGS